MLVAVSACATIKAQGNSMTTATNTRATFVRSQGTREFVLYVPATRRASPGSRALIVMLHGCAQNAADFATGTRMNGQAESGGFIVLYPEQPATANPQKCWNWFTPSQSMRGQGEVALLAELIDSVATAHTISANHIALVGMSAGAAMAANLMVAYPERFGALAMHSGIAARAANDMTSALSVMRSGPTPGVYASDVSLGARAIAAMGSHTRGIPVVLLHGDADKVVVPINMQAAAQQFTDVNSAASGARAPVEQHLLPGVGHAWSGGAVEGSYTAPAGPRATDMIVAFFRRTGVLRSCDGGTCLQQ